VIEKTRRGKSSSAVGVTGKTNASLLASGRRMVTHPRPAHFGIIGD
jgi:hypothetical protein